MSEHADLMGTAEIAALLGVSRQRVLKLADPLADNGFPEPLASLSMGKVWDGKQVRKWAAGYSPARPTRSAGANAASKPTKPPSR